MAFKYLPHTDEDIQAMLQVVGVPSLEALYAEVPTSLIYGKGYDIPDAQSEIEIRRTFGELAEKNQTLTCFAGAGVYDHYTPAVIQTLISRSEFLTSYTPYQAEISQGTLQYIFEYQTMLADLTGMDYANSSMYDGSTATVEAMFMALAHNKKKKKIIVAEVMNPTVVQVLRTYAGFHGIEIVMLHHKNGQSCIEDLQKKLEKADVAGVFVAQPNYLGVTEDFTGFAEVCHAAGALLIMHTIASTLAILRSPGSWGADIAVGDAQSLGVPLNYGGAYIGYLCTNKALIRKMPGRIVGGTTDANGQRAFVLTMQAREQHIRREKATSNICTNQGLMALFVTIYLSLMGSQGLREVNNLSYAGAHYLYDALLKTGYFTPLSQAPFLNEFCLRSSLDVTKLISYCQERGVLCGIKPQGKNLEDCLLIAVTEQRTKQEIDQLIDLVKAFSSHE